MTPVDRPVPRAAPVLHACLGVSAWHWRFLEQPLQHLQLPVFCCPHERRPALLIARLHIHRLLLQQPPHDLQMPSAGCPHERGVAMLVDGARWPPA